MRGASRGIVTGVQGDRAPRHESVSSRIPRRSGAFDEGIDGLSLTLPSRPMTSPPTWFHRIPNGQQVAKESLRVAFLRSLTMKEAAQLPGWAAPALPVSRTQNLSDHRR
jgi:hypothetical protein